MIGLPMQVKNISNIQNYSNLKNIESSDFDKIDIISITYQDLISDLDYFKYVLKTFNNIKIIHIENYKSLEIINDILNEKTDIIFNILDDGMQMDRSYINLFKLDKISNVSLPISYIMWDVNIKDIQPVTCYTDVFNGVNKAVSNNGNKQITKESLIRIKDIVNKINIDSNLTDVEKTIIISNYLQSKVEYIDSDRNLTGLAETVLFDNYGICMGISCATTLLSNNLIMNLDNRILFGDSHVWNIQNINGIDYLIDNTWNITRNDSRLENRYRATEFTDKYTLFGQDTANKIGHHNSQSVLLRKLNISKEDYDRKELEVSEKKLIKRNNY